MQRQAARLKQQTLLQNGDDPARHARRLRQLRLQRGEHLHIREDQVARLAVECCDMVAQGLEQAAAPCGIHPVDVICVIDGVEMARHTGRHAVAAGGQRQPDRRLLPLFARLTQQDGKAVHLVCRDVHLDSLRQPLPVLPQEVQLRAVALQAAPHAQREGRLL